MQVQLKIKIKSLAAEAGIIRHEERKLVRPKGWREYGLIPGIDHRVAPTSRRVKEGAIPWARDHQKTAEVAALDMRYNSLRTHRVIILRREARASQLAYAFLRGRPYAKTEHKDSAIDNATVEAAARMIVKYGKDNAAVQAATGLNGRTTLLREWILEDTGF